MAITNEDDIMVKENSTVEEALAVEVDIRKIQEEGTNVGSTTRMIILVQNVLLKIESI